MVYFQRTGGRPLAFCGFVVEFVMAWIAEMSRAEAEPQRNRATISALKVDKLTSVLLAVGDTRSHQHGGALRAEQFVLLENLNFLIGCGFTVLHASKVRLFTLETCVVCHFVHVEFYERLVFPFWSG